MSPVSHRNRRRAYRLRTDLPVTFSINGGAIQSANAIDLTHRSIALRSGYPVSPDDSAIVRVSNLPPLDGRVVRVFDGGFAVGGERMSLSLVAHVKTSPAAAQHNPVLHRSRAHSRITGPIFSVEADFPVWARLRSSRRVTGGSDRHYLTMIIAETIDPDDVKSIWLIADDLFWCARLIQLRKRGSEVVLVLLMNGFQLEHAAHHGLAVKIVSATSCVRFMRIEAARFKAHLNNFYPRKLAV